MRFLLQMYIHLTMIANLLSSRGELMIQQDMPLTKVYYCATVMERYVWKRASESLSRHTFWQLCVGVQTVRNER